MSTQILATKLHRPTVASDLVRLPRALERLDDGAAIPLTLDEVDADLAVFVHYLAAAIHTALPDACRRTLALLAAP